MSWKRSASVGPLGAAGLVICLGDVVDDETATDAAAELVAEVRGLHGRVNLLIALVLLVLGVLVQVAFRLD